MEALSPTMTEGRVTKWLKKEGDPVKSGETLAEVETDKAVMELVSRGDGVLRKVLAPEGTTVEVGNLVGIIAAPDEDIAALEGKQAPAAPSPPKEPRARPAAAPTPAPAAAPPAPAPAASAPAPAPAPPAGERIKASPLA